MLTPSVDLEVIHNHDFVFVEAFLAAVTVTSHTGYNATSLAHTRDSG